MAERVTIVIPAYNEEQRIGAMLEAYACYFTGVPTEAGISATLLVVLNGCVDDTAGVVKRCAERYPSISMIELPEAGKGRAIRAGFKHTLLSDATLIGFVDADMATKPPYFYDLIRSIDGYDGVIASRYMAGSQIVPDRPLVKRWGSKFIYEPLVRLLFGMNYHDLQCGAKLFHRTVVEKIAPQMKVDGWACDVEMLYLCKKYQFPIREIPTVWHDQEGSKLDISGSGMKMLGMLFVIWRMHHAVK